MNKILKEPNEDDIAGSGRSVDSASICERWQIEARWKSVSDGTDKCERQTFDFPQIRILRPIMTFINISVTVWSAARHRDVIC